MANYTKSFNFKNGVQVDTDNFVIDPNGLVGVGTTNPGKLLDVYGNARISGVTSLTNANISGIVTVGSQILIDAASGVITATKFVGSAGDLSGIVAIATDGWIQNTGSLSTTAKIGVGTESEATFAAGNGIEIFNATTPVLKLSNENTGTTGADGSQVYLKNDGELVIDQQENKDIRFDLNGSERVKITALGRVGIGSTQPTAELEVAGNVNITGISTLGITSATKLEAQQLIVSGVSTIGATVEVDVDNTQNPIIATRYNVGDHGATLFLQHSKTNTVGVAKSLSVDDEIGSIEFRSYAGDDTTIGRAARIGAIIDADPTDTKVKSALVFETSSAGISGTADERLRIQNDGKVGVGTVTPEKTVDIWNTSANADLRLKTTANSFNSFIFDSARQKDTQFAIIDGKWNGNSVARIQYVTGSDDTNYDDGYMAFHTRKSGESLTERLRITLDGINVAGIATIISDTHIGTGGTIFATSNSGLVGIGTTAATVDLQIRKSSAVELDVVSLNSSSKIGIGKSVGAGNSSAVLIWDDKIFDLRNNDLGDFNMYLHKGNGTATDAGISTGSFNWMYGQGNLNLMSLTHSGNLGIGTTNADETLYVNGDTKITGSLDVEGQITYGSFSLPDPIESKINATTGVSTFSTITVIGGSNNRIGIATETPRVGLDAERTTATFGSVGIGTTGTTDNALEVIGTLQATTIQATNSLFATGFNGTPDITVNNITVNGKLAGGDGSGVLSVGTLKGDGLGISNIHGYANVRNYGAQGDALNGFGSTDDTEAFQEAIDSGKPVFVPPGSYRIDGTLNLNDGYKQLIGAESIPTLIKMSGTGPIINITTTETNRNNYSVVENLHLERKIGYLVTIPSYDATPGFVQAGIALTGIGNTSDAIEKTYISNVRVNNFATGFYFRDVSNVKVERCYTEVSDFNGTVGDDEKYSIGYHFDATRFDNTIGMDSPLGGIELFECYDNRNGTPGTAVTATSSTGIGGTVTNSISYYVKGNDIRDVSFTNCKSESAQRGWYIEGTGTDLDWNIHLTKPLVDKFKKNGAEFKNVNGVGAVSINDGYFNGSNYSEKAIFADTCKGLIVGGGTQIVGVSTNDATGVYLNSSDSCSINANRFSNLKNPIYLEASSYNTLDGNVIGASESPGTVGIGTSLADGINLSGSSDRNTISGNVIKGLGSSTKYFNGIIIGANADKNSLMGNIVDVLTVTNPIVISGTGNTSVGNIVD